MAYFQFHHIIEKERKKIPRGIYFGRKCLEKKGEIPPLLEFLWEMGFEIRLVHAAKTQTSRVKDFTTAF